jgi:endonuclease YncB( thermonuclease family)
MARTWKYEAQLIRVVDGDTIVADIDQGMNNWMRGQYVRFAGINAPEIHGDTKEAGDAAKAFLQAILNPYPTTLYLVTTEYHEFEKYGRVLAYVYNEDPGVAEDLLENSVNKAMLDSGNAVVYP